MMVNTTQASTILPHNVHVYSCTSLDVNFNGLYWIDVILQLQTQMGLDFHKLKFVFYQLSTKEIPQISILSSPNTVLFVLSDNSGMHYEEEFSGFLCVFKVHLNNNKGKVHSIPLGYTRMHKSGSSIPTNERKTSVFYSGNLNSNRVDMYRSLLCPIAFPYENIKNRKCRKFTSHVIKRLKLKTNFDNTFPSSYIRFTEGFSKGLNAENYTRYLADSKIAISPRGYWRPECFRHFEAMRSGCIIISDPLPETWYFKNSPIIQLERWSDLRKIVNSLLKDNKKMHELQSATLEWWDNKCSPESVAKYIYQSISSYLKSLP